MEFVALLYVTIVAYRHCRLMTFVAYRVCRLMTFVVHGVFMSVSYRVCRRARKTYLKNKIQHI